MGYLRFRRSIRIIPGVRLNLNKKGVSVTAGVRGAHYTIGRLGTRTTFGIPGTGLSYTDHKPYDRQQMNLPAGKKFPLLWAIIIFWFLIMLAFANAGTLPDKNLTGGSVRTLNLDLACGHAKENRGPMTNTRRDKILTEYGLPSGTHPDYEIDHLIPLCLGGADDDSNLWAQPRRTIEETWNAEAKDRLEHHLCSMVCRGDVEISDAQEAIATDWIKAYHEYYEAK
jgi:hypothetical protein